MKKKLKLPLMMVILFSFFIEFSLYFYHCFALTPITIEQIKETGSIKVVTNAEFPPFEYKDGNQIVGIDIDISKEIANSLGVELKIEDVAFNAISLELSSNTCNFAAAAMSFTEEKANALDFSDSYFSAKQSVIVKNDSKIKNKQDLAGKIIGVHLGTTGDTYCTENLAGADVKRYDSGSEAVMELINGRIDAVVIDDFPAQNLFLKNKGQVSILDEVLFEEEYRIAVKKGNTELLNSINATLRTINNNGKLNEIIAKYTKKSESFGSTFFEQIYNNLIYKERYFMIFEGLGTTLLISTIVLFIGTLIGSIIAFIKFSSSNSPIAKFFKFCANVYLTIIRGTPLLVQLFIIYYLIFAKTGFSKIVIAVIAFGINSGAYVAEIIRSGLLSVDKGQFESGRSLGLSNRTTMMKIILPQALKNVIATLCNEFITLIKETSIVSFIGLVDLARAGDIIRSQTYEPMVPLLSVALIYLAIIWIITSLMSFFERRLRKSDNR